MSSARRMVSVGFVSFSLALGAGLGLGTAPALAAGDANQTACPFETESSPGFRTYLPDCRAYELVTPPYKDGALLLTQPAAISSDGEHVIVGAQGAFAASGNEWFEGNRNPDLAVYELTRTAGGWQPTALTPPATRYPHGAIMAASTADELQTTLWGLATTTLELNEDIYLREPGGTFAEVGPGVAPEVSGDGLQFESELNLAGASADLTHSVFWIEAFSGAERLAHEGHSNLWPGDTTKGGYYSLYEYVGTGNTAPTLVGISDGSTVVGGVTLPAGQVISRCGTELGSGGEGIGSASRDTYNAVSQDGETVFFTAHAAPQCSGPGEPTVNELYARVGQSKTVAISEPSLPAGECTSPEPCSGATPKEAVFQGASENGGRVFFLSEQPLVNGAPAAGVKLYEARLEGATVSQVVDVSVDPTSGQSPEVQGVVRVCEDGQRVYFVAKGKLTGADAVAGRNPETAEPEESADNLYVYNPESHSLTFVVTLLTAAEETALSTEESTEASKVEELAFGRAFRAEEEAVSHGASAEEAFHIFLQVEAREKKDLKGTLGPSGTLAADRNVWQVEDARPAQATADGGVFLFSSSADLTPGDESKVPQLFEYDAVTQKLSRVSISQGATYSDDGNASTFDEAAHIPTQTFVDEDLPTAESFGSALSGDGSKVLFTTAARLAPQAVGGVTNVYEYREGNVYLVSDGHDASLTAENPTVKLLGSDSSGQDAFFLSADQLVPQDSETQGVLYDAREDGGFPAPALVAGCSGETCRGTTSTTPELQLPGSTSQAGGGNLPPPVQAKPPAKPKPKPLTRAQKLAKALKACMSKRNKQKRASCQAEARKAFAAKVTAAKSTRRAR